MTELALAPDAAERWVQGLGQPHITQALVGFGLWMPSDGAVPTDNLDAAYQLAQRALGLERRAISFRPEGRALVCLLVHAGRPITASAQPQGKRKAESGKMKEHTMQSVDIGALTYDSQLSAFSSQLSLALTRAVLRAVYEAQILSGGEQGKRKAER